jgi:PAS domain S-box-containing protein
MLLEGIVGRGDCGGNSTTKDLPGVGREIALDVGDGRFGHEIESSRQIAKGAAKIHRSAFSIHSRSISALAMNPPANAWHPNDLPHPHGSPPLTARRTTSASFTYALRIAAQRGFPQWWLDFWDSVSRGQGACGTALELGQRVVVEDVESSPIFETGAREVQRRAGVRAVQSTPLFTRSGKPLGVFSTHYKAPYRPDERSLLLLDLLARHAGDLIERALADQALAESEDKYATIFQLSPFAIALTKLPEGILVDANDAFLNLFEYTRADVIGMTSIDLGIADPSSYHRVRVLLETQGSVQGLEVVRRTKAGARRVLSLHVNRVTIGGEPHVLTHAADVTERHEGELRRQQLTEQVTDLNRDLERRVTERTEELRHAREVAEAASRAKSEFLSSMSHEIRTPLNSILGFTQLLQRDKKSPPTERQLEKLDHVLRSGEHLLHLIDDVLDLSRIEAGRITISPEPVGLTEILAEVHTTLGPMASRMGISLVLEPLPPEMSRVRADRTRLSQILINYGSNALKYGRKGGRATLSVSALENDFIRVAVTDDGIGIPDDKQSKVFDPFERAGQEMGPIEGTGIGLAITKRLAELMGGCVGFRSEVGRGSTFWIDLPVHLGEPDLAQRDGELRSAPLQARGRAGNRRTIVYVEDNPSNVALMESLVQELEQFALVAVPTAEAGLDFILEHRPDVVFMDMNLPGMSGREAMRRLRQWPETENIPVIALTAAAMADQRERAKDAGFYRYLTKPIRIAEVVEVLDTLFA